MDSNAIVLRLFKMMPLRAVLLGAEAVGLDDALKLGATLDGAKAPTGAMAMQAKRLVVANFISMERVGRW